METAHSNLLFGHSNYATRRRKRQTPAQSRWRRHESPNLAGSYPIFTNLSDAESVQYLNPVGFGPSSNRSPRCASHRRHFVSLFSYPPLGLPCTTFSSAIGSQKLGQPVPESNLALELKSAVPQHTQRKIPWSYRFQYAPVKARSVPRSRAT